jgi:hypothetical protein
MIAVPRGARPYPDQPWHAGFVAMMPTIARHASLACKGFNKDAREEFIQEVLCNALVAYKRLYDQGKVELAYPTVLAMYGVRQAFDGRKVGGKLNVNDVASAYAQKRKGFKVERLDHYDPQNDEWRQVLVEDRHTGPAETAAVRLDFEVWLRTLGRRDRGIALRLATGETTLATAREFGVSPGRISQLRRELMDSWEAFQGEDCRELAVV